MRAGATARPSRRRRLCEATASSTTWRRGASVDRQARDRNPLDVDYHHGNGTQQIFYDRDDVYFVSIHADPVDEYPFFLGCAT